VGQAVRAVHYAINAALKDLVTATKLLFFRHIVARHQTKFSRFPAHIRAQVQQTETLMPRAICLVVLMEAGGTCTFGDKSSNPLGFSSLAAKQLDQAASSSKISGKSFKRSSEVFHGRS
jgi:hypothetical protein